MWASSKPRAGGGVGAPPQVSSSPFFPDVAARVSYHPTATISLARKHTGQGHRAVDQALGLDLTPQREEVKENTQRSPLGLSVAARYEQRVNATNQYPRAAQASPKKLTTSHSTESLRGGREAAAKTMQYSASTSVLPPGESSTGSYPYSGPNPAPLTQPSPSNASAKLASRAERWAPIEDLLEHSFAVIAAGGKMVHGSSSSATVAGHHGYDSNSFNTFSSGEPTPLRTPKPEPKRRPRPAATPTLSPFSTVAPPPLPPPSPATWGGSSQHATSGLLGAISNENGRELMADISRKLTALERSEKVITVNPSVLFAAGMIAEEPSTSTGRSGSPTRKTFQTKSASELLWLQHQQMMTQARASLPTSLKQHTQQRVIDAVQGLKPQVLLDVLSPQAHILAVSLSELVSQLRKDSHEKAALLSHLAAHQRLVSDTLLQFVAVSVATLEGDDTEATNSMRQLTDAIEATSVDGAASSSLAALLAPPADLATSIHRHERAASQSANFSASARSSPASSSYSPVRASPVKRREAYDSDSGDEYEEQDQFNLDGPLEPSASSLASRATDESGMLGAEQLAPVPISFGNSHAWELERWRQNALARRRIEAEHEKSFLEAIELVRALSELRHREQVLVGAERFRDSDRDSYAKVNGSWEKDRQAMQARLDALKLQIEPAYAANYVRHHQRILEVAQVERDARAAEVAKQNDSSFNGGSSDAEDPTILAAQLSLLRQSERHHSTNKSAPPVSATPGGRAHRLPHNIWLATSTPSSHLLADDAPAGRAGPTPAGQQTSANLRTHRIQSLVTLENCLTDAHEAHGVLLDQHRSLVQQHQALLEAKRTQDRVMAEQARTHAEAIAQLEAALATEVAKTSRAEVATSDALGGIVLKNKQIESLTAEMQGMAFSTKRLQEAYAQYVTNRVSEVDAQGQTDEMVTGLSGGGWDALGRIVTSPSTPRVTAPAALEAEIVANLAAQGTNLISPTKDQGSPLMTPSGGSGSTTKRGRKPVPAAVHKVAASMGGGLSSPGTPSPTDSSRRSSHSKTNSATRRSQSLGFPPTDALASERRSARNPLAGGELLEQLLEEEPLR